MRWTMNLNDEAVRRRIINNLEKLFKNVREDNEFRLSTAEDLLNLFCWQVDHGETPSEELLKYFSTAFQRILKEEVSAEAALGLHRKPGPPKSPPEKDFLFAVYAQLERFGALSLEDLNRQGYMPITAEQFSNFRCKHPAGTKSLEESFSAIGELYSYSADRIKLAYQKMKSDDLAADIAKTRSAAELRNLLAW